jgi:hypothetical protein
MAACGGPEKPVRIFIFRVMRKFLQERAQIEKKSCKKFLFVTVTIVRNE